MPIRKGRLRKPCTKCGKMFQPNGKWNVVCSRCQRRSFVKAMDKKYGKNRKPRKIKYLEVKK